MVDSCIIPDDPSTLFVCSGMQRVRGRFLTPDGSKHGSLQSCIRTNDLDLVGDGLHLTYFQMLGNFSFGGDDYELSVELWHSLLTDLGVPVDGVHCHPERPDLWRMWQRRGYPVVPDLDCVWSDGTIGGHCCEIYSGGLEIGNLVNPLGHSTDVGFGWERLVQVIEGKPRVDQTSLFPKDRHPVVVDHERTLVVLRENSIEPGNKGREYVCRRLLRRMLRLVDSDIHFVFDDWLDEERGLLENCLRRGRKSWRRHRHRSPSWWWETFGILPEELHLLSSG